MTHQPRLLLTLADRIDVFLARAKLHGLRVKHIRLSYAECMLLRHEEPVRYGEGRYDGVLIRIRPHEGRSPWAPALSA